MDLTDYKDYVTVYRLINRPDHYMINDSSPDYAGQELMRLGRYKGHSEPEDSAMPVFKMEIVFSIQAPDRQFINFIRDQAEAREEETEQMRLGEWGWYIFGLFPSFEEWIQRYEIYKQQRLRSLKQEALPKLNTSQQLALL